METVKKWEVKHTSKDNILPSDGNFSMKLGYTTYSVNICFNKFSKITLADKVMNLLKQELKSKCVVASFKNQTDV